MWTCSFKTMVCNITCHFLCGGFVARLDTQKTQLRGEIGVGVSCEYTHLTQWSASWCRHTVTPSGPCVTSLWLKKMGVASCDMMFTFHNSINSLNNYKRKKMDGQMGIMMT
jgi:hypothetical protein